MEPDAAINGDGEVGGWSPQSTTSDEAQSFRAKLRASYLSKDLFRKCPTDLIVRVQDRNFRLHKDLFVLASPVFESVLSNDISVAADGHYSVELLMEPQVFKLVCRFLYTGDLPQNLNMEMVLKLMEVGFQYRILDLLTYAIAEVQKMITAETAFKVLKTARAMGSHELQELALQLIYCNTDQLETNSDFITLGCYDVCRILSSDSLRCREIDVFNAAIAWAENQARRSKDPSKARKYYFSQVEMCIRFTLFSLSELATFTLNNDVFDQEHLNKVFQYHCLPEEQKSLITLKCNMESRSHSLPKTTNSPTASKETQTYIVREEPVKLDMQPPVASPNPASRKRSVSGSTEVSKTLESETTPKKIKISNRGKGDSDDDAWVATIHDKQFHSYEELVRRYIKEKYDELSGFHFSKITLRNNYHNMLFQNCKELKLEAQCSFFDKSGSSFLEFVSHFDPMRYIVFNTKATIRMSPEHIWSLNQDILLKFNGVTFLRANHKKHGFENCDLLVINYVSDSKKIMSNPKLCPTVLALSNCELSLKALKERGKQIEKLILYRVWGDYTFEEIMKDYPSLKELVCWKHVPKTGWIEGTNFTVPLCLNFSNTFAAKSNLQKLVLFKTELKFPMRCSNVATSVMELVLDHCHCVDGERNACISDVFHLVFPALKRLTIVERPSFEKEKHGSLSLATASLINNVCQKIETIEWIMIAGMQWNDSEGDNAQLSTFLEQHTKITGRPKNFRIEKIGDGWSGTNNDDRANESPDIDGGFWSERDEMEYRWYNLNYFYDSYELYEDYFKQEDSFPRPSLRV